MVKIFKSAIQSIVRVLWIYIFRPFVKLLPDNRLRARLFRAGRKIEKRQWWGYSKDEFKNEFSFPPYLIEELHALGQIEYALSPSDSFMFELSINEYDPAVSLQRFSVGDGFSQISRALGGFDFDVVFLAPWLKRGGADLGLLHHIQAQVDSGHRVLLITTLKADSPWVSKLPKSVHYLNWSDYSDHFSMTTQTEILARLLMQTSAQVIHNINSDLGWNVFKRYGKQLTAVKKKLFISVFCEEIDEDGLVLGYAPQYLAETYTYLSKVFCDTQYYPKLLSDHTGLYPDVFETVYFPYKGTVAKNVQTKSRAPILWASRFVDQKYPELLLEIAKKLPDYEFHIHGECDNNHKHILKELMGLPNVQYFGSFDSFKEICLEQVHSLLLYTSKFDGLPNILLEAIANGLPVIASDVGGVCELLADEVVVHDKEDVQAYVDKVKAVFATPNLLEDSWKYSINIIKSRHQWSDFLSVLEQIDGYFPSEDRQFFKPKNQNYRVLTKPNSASTSHI